MYKKSSSHTAASSTLSKKLRYMDATNPTKRVGRAVRALAKAAGPPKTHLGLDSRAPRGLCLIFRRPFLRTRRVAASAEASRTRRVITAGGSNFEASDYPVLEERYSPDERMRTPYFLPKLRPKCRKSPVQRVAVKLDRYATIN